MASLSGRLSATGRAPPIPPLKPKHQRHPSLSTVRPAPPAVFSKYLMNDIPRGTSRAKLMNCLQPVSDIEGDSNATKRPAGDSRCIITDSRLDDELSVAVIEFSNTPKWLQYLNKDLYGFPKKTALGTLWRGIDIGTGEIDEHRRSELIRAAMEGSLIYAETLAEFKDTDVNVQDDQGRSALHWACARNHIDIVMVCLSIPECDIGLRDKDNLTAFDLALADTKMLIPALFYKNILDMDESHPQTALLRMLTVTSEPADEVKAIFPGEAIFDPIEDSNKPLVKALIKRGIDLTARDRSGDTALHVAVKATNVEIAIRLLKAGSDVDAIGKGGATPLHYATSEKRMVQVLLSWEAKPNMRNDQGMTALDVAKDADMVRHELNRKANDTENLTPLHRAAEDGDTETVRLLLELGAGVDEKSTNGSGQTALMLAAMMGHTEVGELLVEAGANIEARDENGCTPVDLALTPGFSQLLGGYGVMVTGRKETEGTGVPLVGLTDMHSKPAADFLIADDGLKDSKHELNCATEEGGDMTPGGIAVEEVMPLFHRLPRKLVKSQLDTGLSPLLQASQEGDLAKLQLLLSSGIDMEVTDTAGRTALYIAAKNGHTETVQALLANGAQTEAAPASGGTPLYFAALYGYTEIVQALLASGARTESAPASGGTPLYFAALYGYTEIVQALLASGAQIEAAPASGATPLYIAARYGYTEIVQALLASGAQIDAALESGATPLYIAARYGYTEIIQALLASGAQTEAALESGATPLYIAARYGYAEIVRALLGSGAHTEAAPASGATPLHIAAQNGHTETVQALLISGAKTEAALESGATPLHIAAQIGHTEIVKALLTGGAQTEAALKWGAAPLYIAARNGHTETVQALLTSGAQTEAALESGARPLHIAAENGRTNTVQALLAGGADPRAKNSDGKTPLSLAISSQHKGTAKVLRAARSWRASDLTAWVNSRR